MATEERETMTLIGSDKVEGTAVYGADEGQIGSIERVMIDKRSGKVSYSVLSFGGFLGIGTIITRYRGSPSSTIPALAATGPASPKSSCRVRPNTAATTIGVGRIEPELGASMITMALSLPEPTF